MTAHEAGDRPAKSRAEVRDIYEENAARFERFGWLEERLVGRYRERLFSRAEGRVLDVACGTGPNFAHLPERTDLVGVDLSEAMLRGAARTARDLDRDADLRVADAEALPFEDDAFDTVVSALSTCTFPDPVAVLREMDRVCAPDGRILLFEHGRSSVPALARLQDRFASRHFERMGCRWNQEPVDVVREAGLRVEGVRRDVLGLFTSLVVVPTA
ncbi:class I SAM-dependent methyltransferase [Halomarina ordinaria]|uniref:Class I SAM-dependent methyltransferase n=1 Tax=Halomarina ordinaria TaxID=3033939 RepID=A0ABD5UBJ6_9EURY|nr:class I SAM-dependent methyltransferase [Halomarina sp. PSRA2]